MGSSPPWHTIARRLHYMLIAHVQKVNTQHGQCRSPIRVLTAHLFYFILLNAAIEYGIGNWEILYTSKFIALVMAIHLGR